MICEHIIRHYNEGWADGYHYGIKYWEIWNEPDNDMGKMNQMWTGTPQQYYELYDVTTKHLKACFGDTIKVGGYACTSFGGFRYCPEKYGMDIPRREKTDRYENVMWRLRFFEDFWAYIKEQGSPIDFFSWHTYGDVNTMVLFSQFLDIILEKYGYTHIESHLNEWNNAHDRKLIGSSYASAAATAAMCAMQNTSTDMMCYYDSRIGASNYGGLFDPMQLKAVSTYYALAAFGELYALGTQMFCETEGEGIYAQAAADGDRKAVLLTNFSENEAEIALNVDDDFDVYLLEKDVFLEKTEQKPSALHLKANQVVLIKNY